MRFMILILGIIVAGAGFYIGNIYVMGAGALLFLIGLITSASRKIDERIYREDLRKNNPGMSKADIKRIASLRAEGNPKMKRFQKKLAKEEKRKGTTGEYSLYQKENKIINAFYSRFQKKFHKAIKRGNPKMIEKRYNDLLRIYNPNRFQHPTAKVEANDVNEALREMYTNGMRQVEERRRRGVA